MEAGEWSSAGCGQSRLVCTNRYRVTVLTCVLLLAAYLHVCVSFSLDPDRYTLELEVEIVRQVIIYLTRLTIFQTLDLTRSP